MADNDEVDQHWQIVASGDIVVSNSPKELWDAACRYFKWCDEHPIVRKRTLTGGKYAGSKINEETARPYNVKALCLHCGIMEEYLRDCRGSTNKNDGYYIVASRILYIIYTQMAEQAIVGTYNPIFTAKMLNMDNEDVPVKAIEITIVPGLPALSNSENEILKKLELEMSIGEKPKEQNF